MTLYDTIVANNTGSVNNPTDVSGHFISLGHNLIGLADINGSGFVSSDQVGYGLPVSPRVRNLPWATAVESAVVPRGACIRDADESMISTMTKRGRRTT